MATRFYLPSSGTPPLPTQAIDGIWDLPASGDPEFARLPCSTAKSDTSLTTVGGTWASTASLRWCIAQYQTAPLAADYSFTTGDSGQYVVGKCVESATGADTVMNIRAWVVSGDGSTNRGLIFTGTSSEFPTTAASRTGTDSAMNAVDAFAGDRIIFEVGGVGTTPTASSSFSFDVGDPSATSDFAFSNGLTTDLCPWVEFSADLSFASGGPDVELSGSVSQTGQTVSGTATITPITYLDGGATQTGHTVSGTATLDFPSVTPVKLKIRLQFNTDDGVAESFTSAGAWPDPYFDGSNGNPAGSAKSDLSAPTSPDQKHFTQSISAWGVPTGATVTEIGNLSADHSFTMDGASHDAWPGVLLQIGTNGTKQIEYLYPNASASGNQDWTAVEPLQYQADQSPYALTDQLTVSLDFYGTCSSYINQWYDNIEFDIWYLPQADVELDGGATQGGQSVGGTLTFPDVSLIGDVSLTQGQESASGTATFVDPIDVRLIQRTYNQTKQTVTGGLSLDDEFLLYGGATQRSHRNSGILLLALTTDVAAPVPAGTRYTLTIDGTEYPLISAVVERHSRYERASATIPSAIIQEVIASSPVTLEITITRVLADGSGTTDTTLFTGTIDVTKTTSGDQTGMLVADGAASYPARVNRQLQGAPSYIRDSAESTAVRGQIDPDLVPGDVLRFSGVREIPVTKAVFNLTTDFQFMEAISGF